MPRCVDRGSHRLHRLAHVRLQRRLAEHLREVEATRIWNGEPRHSIRLQFQYDPTFRYIIFGKEGYVVPNDPFEGEELPSFGWREDRRHLLQPQQGGDNVNRQRGVHQLANDAGAKNAPDNKGTSGHFQDQGPGTATGGADEDNKNEGAETSSVKDSDVHYTPSTPRDSGNDNTRSWSRRDSNKHYTPRDGEDDNASGELL